MEHSYPRLIGEPSGTPKKSILPSENDQNLVEVGEFFLNVSNVDGSGINISYATLYFFKLYYDWPHDQKRQHIPQHVHKLLPKIFSLFTPAGAESGLNAVANGA